MSKKLQQISVPLISVFLGILLGAIVMWIFGYDAIWGYEELFYTAFGSLRGIGEIFRAMGPLVLIGLGFAVASRAGFFNVGLPGQALAGWILSGWFALSNPDMPRLVLIPLTVIIALIAGGIVGAIPGILRAYLGTSEVIVTIMMNYIVLYVGNAFIHAFPKDIMQSTDSTIRVSANATYQTPWLSELTGNSRMNIGIFFAIIAVVLVWFLLKKTTLGFEIRSVGINPQEPTPPTPATPPTPVTPPTTPTPDTEVPVVPQAELPQTGEHTSNAGFIGLLSMIFAAFVGFFKRRKED